MNASTDERCFSVCYAVIRKNEVLTAGRSPAPWGGVWPWGCRGAGAPPPEGGVKAPFSESSSALRAPGRSSGAPAMGEFTVTVSERGQGFVRMGTVEARTYQFVIFHMWVEGIFLVHT